MGKLAFDLGNSHRPMKQLRNNTKLFRLFVNPDTKKPEEVTPDQLTAALAGIEQAIAPLARARMQRPDAALIQEEFATAAAMLRHAAKRGQWLLDRNAADSKELAADLRLIIGQHEQLWLARNRPGGLVE